MSRLLVKAAKQQTISMAKIQINLRSHYFGRNIFTMEQFDHIVSRLTSLVRQRTVNVCSLSIYFCGSCIESPSFDEHLPRSLQFRSSDTPQSDNGETSRCICAK